MKDYTKEIGFWKRLESFVSDVQTGCCAGEEEKEMIMHVCKLKILDLQNVSNKEVSVCECEPHTFYEWEKDENKCCQCNKQIFKQTDC